MEKPPAKKQHSAEVEHAPDELRTRLVQLADDYASAFFRDPSKENLQTAQLLRAIGEDETLRRKLHEKRTSLVNRAARFTHAWQRWFWVSAIPAAVRGRNGDPKAVAQDLILYMPATLRAECPNYPTDEAELTAAVAAVVSVRNFEHELAVGRHSEQGLDVLEVARAVLRGLGVTANDAKNLIRESRWEAWQREHGAT